VITIWQHFCKNGNIKYKVLYVKALGYNQYTIGHIVGMTALASAIILVPAGILNDRFGSKRIISIRLFLVIPALLDRSLLTAEHKLLVSAFIAGMSLAVVSATFMPFLPKIPGQSSEFTCLA
jgi:MFS family permease